MKFGETEGNDFRTRKLSRKFILFAAAVRQATSGESLSKKIGANVTEAQADALRFLALNEPVTIGEIALGLGHTISGATKAIDRLERNGWVLRNQEDNDHRMVSVNLTPGGRELALQLLQASEERMIRILRRLRPETFEKLEGVLEEFLRDFIDDEKVANKLCIACGFEGGMQCSLNNTECVVARSIQHLSGGTFPA